MAETSMGILHPGEMGASVGAAARAAGNAVTWASERRSAATVQRAEQAGLEDCGSLASMVGRADVIISVCPPDAAITQAGEAADAGFSGIYVDANAIAPESARRIASVMEAAGGHFVDGGIIGPPAWRQGTTRLYLSGPQAPRVAALFAGGPLEVEAMDTRPGAASALKMCYAAYTKGSAALLVAIRALAAAEGVDRSLSAEWSLSQPGLETRSEAAARGNAFKAWRFAGEMLEIAETFSANELPAGFHHAAAEIYDRLAAYKDCDSPPELAQVVDTVLSKG
jgi:3-hydroxyisobutyrate dehydrogenase-like beta-hydroxyacid dehydrogenase